MQNALNLSSTTIGKKALVAVTGLVLFGFVIGHMAGNLQVFLGPGHLNAYAAFLQSQQELLWVARIVLLVSLITHVALIIDLNGRNQGARKSRYKVETTHTQQSPFERYARSTMILSGPIVLLFILFHLAHFTLGVVPGLPFEHGDVYNNVVLGFQNPVIAGIYIFANILLGLHLFHGGHSMLQTLGFRNPRLFAPARSIAMGLAILIVIGNVAMPTAALARIIQPAASHPASH